MKVLAALVLLALVGVAGVAWLRRPHLPPAERGRRIAESNGCFACHGAAGTRGAANPGRNDKTVPTFAGDLMMFADNADDVRDWITNGVTAKKKVSKTWQDQRAAGTLRMPAFKNKLSERDISDLVAYVMVVSDSPEPKDSLALAGRDRAKALGCTGCHGFGGRLSLPNPGSLKDYVPSWDGKDFPEVVASEDEFKQWVEHGVSDRFKSNPAAMFFLKRARLHMPSFERHLADGDLARLWAYIEWLRSPAANPDSAGVSSF